MNMKFDYYYGQESEQFSFFRIPRLLFQDGRFKKLSCEAKLLYGLMLDRLSLSQKNNWIDEEGRVYIIYKLEHICIEMNCGKDKAVKVLAELDAGKGIGLIERKKQGQGRATIIYVKNFASVCGGNKDEEDSGNDTAESEENSRIPDFGKTEVWNSVTSDQTRESTFACRKVDNSEPETADKSADFGKSEVKTSEKPNSRLLKNRSQDFGKSAPSYIDNNKTDRSETDPIHPSLYPEPVSWPGLCAPKSKANDRMDNNPIQTTSENSDQTAGATWTNETVGAAPDGTEISCSGIPDAFKRRFIPTIDPTYFGTAYVEDTQFPDPSANNLVATFSESAFTGKKEGDTPYRRLIRENIGYDRHMKENPYDELYRGFYELICDIAEGDHKTPIYVNKNPMPPEVVRSRFLKIKEPHMEYVVESFRDNPNPNGIHNVRSYMLTMLYNAPVTFDAHICQKVNHDMYGGGWEEKGIGNKNSTSPYWTEEGGLAYAG